MKAFENIPTITVEDDVERTPKKTRKMRGVDENDPRLITLRGMKPGESFFLEGLAKADIRPLMDLGRRLEIPLIAKEVEQDEIYQTKGTRVWRVNPEEMRGGKAKAPTVDVVRYWHHPESSCVFRTGPGTGKPHTHADDVDGLCEAIDEAQYRKLQAEYDDDL